MDEGSKKANKLSEEEAEFEEDEEVEREAGLQSIVWKFLCCNHSKRFAWQVHGSPWTSGLVHIPWINQIFSWLRPYLAVILQRRTAQESLFDSIWELQSHPVPWRKSQKGRSKWNGFPTTSLVYLRVLFFASLLFFGLAGGLLLFRSLFLRLFAQLVRLLCIFSSSRGL